MHDVRHSAADLLSHPALLLYSSWSLPTKQGVRSDQELTPQSRLVGEGNPTSKPGGLMDARTTENGFHGGVTSKESRFVQVRQTSAGSAVRIGGSGCRVEFTPGELRSWGIVVVPGGVGISNEHRVPFVGGLSAGVAGVRFPLSAGSSTSATYAYPLGQGKERVDVELAWHGKDSQVSAVYGVQNGGPSRGVVLQQKMDTGTSVAAEVGVGGHRDTGPSESQFRATVRSESGAASDARCPDYAIFVLIGSHRYEVLGERIDVAAKTPDSQRGLDKVGSTLLKMNGFSETLLPGGVIKYLSKNGQAFEQVPGRTSVTMIPRCTQGSPVPHDAAIATTTESSMTEGYRVVAPITAPLRAMLDQRSTAVNAGDALRANLAQKRGECNIVTPEKICALLLDRIKGSGEATDGLALRSPQGYLRYGYVEVGAEADVGSSLVMPDVNENTRQVVSGHLDIQNGGSYILDG